MTEKFTPNDLVRYIYKETSLAESLAIEEAFNEDWNLYETYEELHKAYAQLPKVSFAPSPTSIRNILKYSAQSGVPA